MRAVLEELAAHAPDEIVDTFGRSSFVAGFEEEMAATLGQEAAVFAPKGTHLQHAAIKCWCVAGGHLAALVHRQSHIAVDEERSLERVSAIRIDEYGGDGWMSGIGDLPLQPAADCGVLVAELPLRRAGFLVPDVDALVAMRDWAVANRLRFHIDGARLWECLPWFGARRDEVLGLADSIYVSFYKGLGGLGGGLLAGKAEFVLDVRRQLTLLAAFPSSIAPYVVAARLGLQRHLPRMQHYASRAMALSAALKQAGFALRTDPVRSNGFALEIAAPAEAVVAASLAIAEDRGDWLVSAALDCGERSVVEIVVGAALDDWRDDEAVAALLDLQRRAREI